MVKIMCSIWPDVLIRLLPTVYLLLFTVYRNILLNKTWSHHLWYQNGGIRFCDTKLSMSSFFNSNIKSAGNLTMFLFKLCFIVVVSVQSFYEEFS
jgi:hypothetical protein